VTLGKKTSIVTKFVKFRNVTEKESAKKRQGVYLVNRGLQIATRPTWAFQEVPPEGGAFWRKQPRSPGRVGWQASPSIPYK